MSSFGIRNLHVDIGLPPKDSLRPGWFSIPHLHQCTKGSACRQISKLSIHRLLPKFPVGSVLLPHLTVFQDPPHSSSLKGFPMILGIVRSVRSIRVSDRVFSEMRPLLLTFGSGSSRLAVVPAPGCLECTVRAAGGSEILALTGGSR